MQSWPSPAPSTRLIVDGLGDGMNLGNRVVGCGVMALGTVCLASGAFMLSQAEPSSVPYPHASAYLAGGIMLAAGAGIESPRTIAWAASALTAFYAAVVLLFIDIPFVALHAGSFGSYSGVAEEVAIASGALIIFATTATISPSAAARLVHGGQKVFGACAVLFGGAHFAYMNLTAPLVPSYLPPSQEFWAYATGICQIAAGIAILNGVWARLAAILLTTMYASFTPLVHLPMLIADPNNHWYWTENAYNLALTGAAWVVADSMRGRRVFV